MSWSCFELDRSRDASGDLRGTCARRAFTVCSALRKRRWLVPERHAMYSAANALAMLAARCAFGSWTVTVRTFESPEVPALTVAGAIGCFRRFSTSAATAGSDTSWL